jgi:hypothetical protein
MVRSAVFVRFCTGGTTWNRMFRPCSLPAFQFAINTTFNFAIGCTPFEAGHGLAATTIAQARLQATRYAANAEGGKRI